MRKMSRTLQLLTSSRTACLLLCLVLVLETQRKNFEVVYSACKAIIDSFGEMAFDFAACV